MTLVKKSSKEGELLSPDQELALYDEPRHGGPSTSGEHYPRSVEIVLPVEAQNRFQVEGCSFDIGYLLTLVAKDIREDEPDEADTLRQLANLYYSGGTPGLPAEEIEGALLAIDDLLEARRPGS